MRNRSRRSKGDRFIFTNDIDLIKPYAGYHICIEDSLSRFGVNNVILYKKNRFRAITLQGFLFH